MMNLYGLEDNPFPFLLRYKLTPLAFDTLMGNRTAISNSIPPFSASSLQEHTKDNYDEEQENAKTPLDKGPPLEKEISDRTQAHPLR